MVLAVVAYTLVGVGVWSAEVRKYPSPTGDPVESAVTFAVLVPTWPVTVAVNLVGRVVG